jgi:hypothetical protein
MTVRRLAVLQWAGLLAGAAAWACAHIVGYGIAQAECGANDWGINNDVWQGSLLGASALLVVLAEAAALTVLVRTRGASYEDAPPVGRIRFFAIAAAVANVIFLAMLSLDLAGNLVDIACRQA